MLKISFIIITKNNFYFASLCALNTKQNSVIFNNSEKTRKQTVTALHSHETLRFSSLICMNFFYSKNISLLENLIHF